MKESIEEYIKTRERCSYKKNPKDKRVAPLGHYLVGEPIWKELRWTSWVHFPSQKRATSTFLLSVIVSPSGQKRTLYQIRTLRQ